MFADKFKTIVEYRPGGKSRVTATYGGRHAPFAQLRGKLVERVIGFNLLRQDLADARQWAERAKDEMDKTHTDLGQKRNKNGPTIQREFHAGSELARALFVAGLTFYGKAFNKAAGRRLAGLKEKDLDDQFRTAHIFFISLRDAFAAHSGEEQYEYGHVVIAVHPNPNKVRSVVAQYEMLRPNLVFEASDGVTFIELLDHAVDVASKKLAEGKDAIR